MAGAAVIIVAAIAATVSYQHIYLLALTAGPAAASRLADAIVR
jgi:hypothetical protein